MKFPGFGLLLNFGYQHRGTFRMTGRECLENAGPNVESVYHIENREPVEIMFACAPC